ncbi:MAG: cobalamin biosynthesis protein [Pseudomonadales bacterium]|nr:cobalamin biosynthesis protein [Pseudomonadales bacterium]
MHRKIRIITLTDAGLLLAEKLKLQWADAEIWHSPKPFAEKVQQAFKQGDALIMVCATGIVVRTLAPVLNNKLEDPPVLVLDEKGQFVIPLLSGHEGGANQWAYTLADKLGAQLVMTTAESYLQPVYSVGMGCERGCPKEHLEELLEDALKQANLPLNEVLNINSINIKADELGLVALAKNLNKPYQTFSKEALLSVEHLLSTKSDYVYNTVGVYGVAESAALFAAQSATNSNSELILNKIKTTKATCAIARSYVNAKK